MKTYCSGALCIALMLATTSLAKADSFPVYRGRILDRNTKQPMPGLIVEAQLQQDALPTAQRIVGRAKTDSRGHFVVRLTAARRDITLIASKKGSTSKLIDFGGQTSMMTDIEQPLAIETNPSEKKENILYALGEERRKK